MQGSKTAANAVRLIGSCEKRDSEIAANAERLMEVVRIAAYVEQ